MIERQYSLTSLVRPRASLGHRWSSKRAPGRLAVALAFSACTAQTAHALGADDAPALAAEEPPSEGPSSKLELDMFVDAYAAWQTGGNGTLATLNNHRMFSGQGASLRSENGFSLAFLGFDARYDAGNIGAVAEPPAGRGLVSVAVRRRGDRELAKPQLRIVRDH